MVSAQAIDTLEKGALVCNKCDVYPKVYGMLGLPTQLPWRRFVCVFRKLGYTGPKRARPVQRDRSSTPVVTPMSFHCGNPTWETTSARQCCVSIFANFFSTRMSSCTF